MREAVKHIVKKVTLELIYEVVEERTAELKSAIEDIKKRQEEDFRFINNKIDTQIGQVRQKIGQVRQDVGQLNQKIEAVEQRLNQRIDVNMGQLRQEISQLNQRIDTVIQLLVEINKNR